MGLLEVLLDVMGDGLAVYDRDGAVLHWNRRAAELTGWTPEEAAARRLDLVSAGLTDLGGSLWVDLQQHKDGDSTVVVFSDARDRVALKEAVFRLSELATTDVLTALPNRALGQERLNQALALARREYFHAGVLLIDLDGFRSLNETHGYSAGDQVLREVAARLLECCRESDTCARLGGDEFLVILASMSEAQDAEVAAERVLSAFSRPFTVDGQSLSVGCSIGLAVFPRDGFEAGDLLRNADLAMHRAKDVAGSAYRSSDLRPRLRLVAPAGPDLAAG
jgi:diguanylate cyclase (GGDEF)-like protein